jgi:hypothetical protein
MRRNTKTMYEWRKAYRDKEELMLGCYILIKKVKETSLII